MIVTLKKKWNCGRSIRSGAHHLHQNCPQLLPIAKPDSQNMVHSLPKAYEVERTAQRTPSLFSNNQKVSPEDQLHAFL